ncbi:hypothetical protein AU476_18260 [Cupriavidus sp. UYMSc13B]|nr:hypothetical protein AU476_18260 [Cupriavidus sp. UYMSc13B]
MQFDEPDEESAQPGDVFATTDEILAEIDRCRRSPDAERRLTKAASFILNMTSNLKGRWLPEDLLQEALLALLAGRRKWKTNRVDFLGLVIGVMKSLASSQDNSLETKDQHVVLEGELLAMGDGKEDGDGPVETFGHADASPEALLLIAEQTAAEDSIFVLLKARFAQEDLAGRIVSMLAERKGYTLAEIRAALNVRDGEFWNAHRRLTRAIDDLSQTGMKS